jgi:regulator-associated protein of mTOR
LDFFFFSVWDWKTGAPLSVIDNHNPPQSRITDMKFINEDDVALLLTGSGKNENKEGMGMVNAYCVDLWY